MDQGFLSKLAGAWITWIIFPGLFYALIDKLLGDRLFLANLIEIESTFNRPPNVDCFWHVKMCMKLGFSIIKTPSNFTDSGYSLLFNHQYQVVYTWTTRRQLSIHNISVKMDNGDNLNMGWAGTITKCLSKQEFKILMIPIIQLTLYPIKKDHNDLNQ